MKPHNHDTIEANRHNDAAFYGCCMALCVSALVVVGLIATWLMFFAEGF